MSPSLITIDTSPDFNFGVGANPKTNGFSSFATRTLLLAPPSVASEGSLAGLLPSYDRTTTDLQMLDRLSAGLVTLPPATYDLVLVLTSADGTRHAEAATLLTREVFAALVPAMKAGAHLKSQDGKTFGGSEAREAVLAGLVEKENGVYEKVEEEEIVMPLRFGKKKNNTEDKSANATNGTVQISPAAPAVKATPAGVGFDFGDDLDDDDDLIDEDELMTEEDLNRPIQIRMCFFIPNPSRPSDLLINLEYVTNHLLFVSCLYIQPPSVPPSLAKSAVPVKTALVAWRSASRPRIRLAVSRPMRT